MTMVSGVVQGASFHAGDSLIDAQERAILGVSANGSVATGGAFVVGQSLDPNTGELAYRWTQDGGFQPLGKLPQQTVLGGFAGQATSTWSHDSNARAISADGLTIVGTSSVGFDLAQGRDWASQAFRWTEQAGMVPLGVLPGHEYSQALDVSRDGGVIVGFGEHVDANVTESDAPHWLTSRCADALSLDRDPRIAAARVARGIRPRHRHGRVVRWQGDCRRPSDRQGSREFRFSLDGTSRYPGLVRGFLERRLGHVGRRICHCGSSLGTRRTPASLRRFAGRRMAGCNC